MPQTEKKLKTFTGSKNQILPSELVGGGYG